ncbi:hypothetical protein ADEAN_000534600 [Angomonas deanei]|uniref:Uncharacterized protein n=1 Tax=Angomonas deanei TaxID=59799 RepID=A0A7G2CDF0_9TRYP|nr:hypothetical protein ADEAN_000534600 [Angomonas deanei]
MQNEAVRRDDNWDHTSPGHQVLHPISQNVFLPRGKEGIDSVLKNAREAQNLLFELQRKRLLHEKKLSQEALKRKLDEQVEFKHMLHIAEYQDELCHIYGPTMRNIIHDTFFDDGSDAILRFFRSEDQYADALQSNATDSSGASPQVPIGVAWDSARRSHMDRVEELLPVSDIPETPQVIPASSSSEMARKRESLNRALDYLRGGKRQCY